MATSVITLWLFVLWIFCPPSKFIVLWFTACQNGYYWNANKNTAQLAGRGVSVFWDELYRVPPVLPSFATQP